MMLARIILPSEMKEYLLAKVILPSEMIEYCG
jgi:hypothetical protein